MLAITIPNTSGPIPTALRVFLYQPALTPVPNIALVPDFVLYWTATPGTDVGYGATPSLCDVRY
eukprot:2969036-Rhodomonas_salina.1